jgi:formylglycine-generating enzyme required for sulfatase activity
LKEKHMDQDFAEVIQRMAREKGKEILVNGEWRKWLSDYLENRYQKEGDLLRRILEAGGGAFINSAADVAARKGEVLVKLENDIGLSPRVMGAYLDLLGLILKGDRSRCGEAVRPGVAGPPVLGPQPAVEARASVPQPRVVTPPSPRSSPGASPGSGMIAIQGGTFLMGSPPSEPERGNDETQHRVTISKGFYMGKYPVTQGEYKAVMGTNPSYCKGAGLPVENVSWYDAVAYCNARSKKEGRSPAYTIKGEDVSWDRSADGYRLPTEAEWEYACRAGTTTPFNTGDNITTAQANYDGNSPYNGNAKGQYRKKTTPVGHFPPNAWGLYDMHGNVWEWCWDWYGDYPSGAQTDPSGASSGASRVIRGGSWDYYAQVLRSAYRFNRGPSGRFIRVGFRLVCS